MRTTFACLTLLAAVAIGFLAGRLSAPEGEAPRAANRSTRPGGEIDTVTTPRVAARSPETTGTPAPDPPSARVLLEYEGGPLVESEIARRAEQIRRTHLRAAERAEQVARTLIEEEIARERAILEDVARGKSMAMLRGLRTDWTPPWALVSAPERYAELFRRRTKGGAVDGTTVSRETELRDGDLLQFPPGRCQLDVNWLGRAVPFPKDLVIEGRGMDETLLVLSDEISVRGEVYSLTIRDLTLHCNNNYLESMRTAPYTLRLERCRVIGFDMGAGGSCMLGGSVGALHATDCRFEAGFGRSPGFGNLFDVRGAFLARLDHCVVVGPFRSVYARHCRAAQLFNGCRFERMSPGIRAQLEEPAIAARFHDCTIEYLPEGTPRESLRREVSELNPAWGD